MTQIEFTNISGQTPIDVYVSDYLGGSRTFIGTVNTPTSLPIPSSLFNTMSSVMVIMSASNGCETFKVIPCTPQPSSSSTFTSIWRTTTPSESIALPVYDGGNYNFIVNWGDGNIETITSYTGYSHTYSTPGDYTVTIAGTVEGWSFGNTYGVSTPTKLIEITRWGNLMLKNNVLAYYGDFRGCTNLVLTGVTDTLNLSGIINLDEVFYGCSSITTINNIENWDVSNITSMVSSFQGTFFNQNIGNWNMSGVTDISGMFAITPFNQDIGGWDVSNVNTINSTFYYTPFNQDISGWNVSNVYDMSYTFEGASSFNQNIGNWDVSNVNSVYSMFNSATAFTQDISGWNVSNVNDMRFMFKGAISFNQDISSWNVSNVIFLYGGSINGMNYMFSGATSFNQDLSGWCVTNLPSEPTDFATGASAWVLPKPIWGTCP